ncbi:MAG: hypothetical protein H7833_00490 [Magnetococcus sp. DMHC-1]
MAANHDDDRYKAIPEWERDVNWIIFLPGVERPIKIPKPFEIGFLFGTIPERLLQQYLGGNSKDFQASMLRGIMDTLAFNPFPQIVKPAMEQWANKSFFTGRDIVGQRFQTKPPELQYDPWTSPTARAVGSATGTSPKRIEHLVRGYFGQLGMFTLGMADMVTTRISGGPEAPAVRLEDLPIMHRFLANVTPDQSAFIDHFHGMMQEVDGLYQKVLHARKHGEPLTLTDQEKKQLATRPGLEQTRKRISDIDRTIRAVWERKDWDGKKKRAEIDRLTKIKNDLAGKTEKIRDTVF